MARTESETDLVERLMGSYAAEAGVYHALLDLARQQGALLSESGDVERCAQLFERKEELLRSIARIEVEIEPLKRRWHTEPADPAARKRVNTLLDSILAIIEAIMEQEQRNEQLLLSCHREIEADLGTLGRAAAMERAQACDDRPVPRFMDLER